MMNLQLRDLGIGGRRDALLEIGDYLFAAICFAGTGITRDDC